MVSLMATWTSGFRSVLFVLSLEGIGSICLLPMRSNLVPGCLVLVFFVCDSDGLG